MNVLIWILTAIHVLVALFLIVLVLMQKSKDQGVGAAFGAGMTDTVFGAGTTTALVRLTIWCACILLATTLLLAVLHSRRSGSSHSLIDKAMQKAPVSQPAPMPLAPSPAGTTTTTPAPAPAPTTAPAPAPTPAPAPAPAPAQ